MIFDTAYFHKVCITILYGSMVVLTFVLFERFVYYIAVSFRTRRLGSLIFNHTPKSTDKAFKRRDVLTSAIAGYVCAINEGANREKTDDLSSAAYIAFTGRIEARLWLLDTIVTAAPLIGLLGTILGIMDTFNALSSGGISDPAAVSRGIASALIATAIGIGTALYALLALNILRRFADHLTEQFKRLILGCHTLGSRDEKSLSNTVLLAAE